MRRADYEQLFQIERDLNMLYRDLAAIEAAPPATPLPAYGDCTREEMLPFIHGEIEHLEDKYDTLTEEPPVTSDELERQRDYLCASQGIARYV